MIYVWQFHVDWKDPSKTTVTGPTEDRRRAVSLPVRRPADQLRAAAGHRSPARRAGRQAHGAPRLPPHRRPRIDRRRALDQHGGRRRRRALVRIPGRRGPHASRSISRARTRPTASIAGWQRRDGQAGQHRHRLLVRRRAELRRPALRRPARERSARPADACARRCSPKARPRRPTTLRWEDYTQTAIDPTDDCTIWYVGDYLKKDATSYSTRIGAFRMPGLLRVAQSEGGLPDQRATASSSSRASP